MTFESYNFDIFRLGSRIIGGAEAPTAAGRDVLESSGQGQSMRRESADVLARHVRELDADRTKKDMSKSQVPEMRGAFKV